MVGNLWLETEGQSTKWRRHLPRYFNGCASVRSTKSRVSLGCEIMKFIKINDQLINYRILSIYQPQKWKIACWTPDITSKFESKNLHGPVMQASKRRQNPVKALIDLFFFLCFWISGALPPFAHLNLTSFRRRARCEGRFTSNPALLFGCSQLRHQNFMKFP
eukprot:s2735_g4.t1